MRAAEHDDADGFVSIGGAADALSALAAAGAVRRLPAGMVLVEQGTPGDSAFVVMSGALGVQVTSAAGPLIAATLNAPALAGEIAVLAGLPRSSTLVAVSDVTIAEVDRDTLVNWLSSQPAIAAEVADAAHDRLRRAQLASMVADLLASPDPDAVSGFVDRAQLLTVRAGEVLYREGDVADDMAFVLAGRLRVTRAAARVAGSAAGSAPGVAPTDGDRLVGDRFIGEIGAGEVVGEIALLQQSARTATVTALRDTSLARIDAASFDELMGKHPQLTLGTARSVIRRVLNPSRQQRNHHVIVVVRVGGLSRDELRAVPLRTLQAHGSVAVLSSDDVDAVLGVGGAQAEAPSLADARLLQTLEEFESSHRFVVLLADDEPTAWSRRAIQRADRVVVVAPANLTPADAATIRRSVQMRATGGAPAWLVLVDPAHAERPTAASRTGVRDLFDEVHHVRRGNDDDLARVTRLAAGVGVGLVLGGGGARGFAHVGVIRALSEQGVPVDRVGGASMGSIFAAASALYSEPDDMMRACAPQFDRLMDYTIPVVSLLKAKRISANLHTVFGGIDAEDLWRPFYCVSTNLTANRQEVHRRGPLTTAIRASIAIPGVLPPVPWGDSLLVDGGVLDNVPVGVMADDPSIGTVIAVDVAPSNGPTAGEDYGMYVSGWQALRGMARRGSRSATSSPYPGVGSVLVRTMITSSEGKRAALQEDPRIDLYLDLDITGVGLLEFDRMQHVVDVGYRLAEPRIRAWATSASMTRLVGPSGP